MNSFRFLLSRTVKRWLIPVLSLLFGGALLVVLILEPGEVGTTDYLISITMGCCTASVMLTMIHGVFLSTDITGNRCIRSSPIAKQLITRSVPIFFCALAVLCSLLFCGIYSAAVVLRGEPISYVSDTVMLSGASVFFCTVMATIAVNFRYGMILMIYGYLPMLVCFFLLPKGIKMNGFGLPVGAAIGFFVAACAAALVISIIISEIVFRKVNFKSYENSELAQMQCHK